MGVAIIISYKIDFEIIVITRNKDRYFIMIKKTIHQKDITLINTHTVRKLQRIQGWDSLFIVALHFFFLLVQDYGKFTYKNKCGTWINISVIIIFISVIFPSYNNVLLGEKYEVMLVKENSNYRKKYSLVEQIAGRPPHLGLFSMFTRQCVELSFYNYISKFLFWY